MAKIIKEIPPEPLAERPIIRERLRELLGNGFQKMTIGELERFINVIVDVAVEEAVRKVKR